MIINRHRESIAYRTSPTWPSDCDNNTNLQLVLFKETQNLSFE